MEQCCRDISGSIQHAPHVKILSLSLKSGVEGQLHENDLNGADLDTLSLQSLRQLMMFGELDISTLGENCVVSQHVKYLIPVGLGFYEEAVFVGDFVACYEDIGQVSLG